MRVSGFSFSCAYVIYGNLCIFVVVSFNVDKNKIIIESEH